jgi:hypothetical protein
MEIYPKIQAGAYVQRFHGTTEINGAIYVVMQDCTGSKSLRESCMEHTLPTNLALKVELAYNVAKSMAWYHRAGLLLKSINDETIVLVRLPNGKEAAFLTGLEHVRHVSNGNLVSC